MNAVKMILVCIAGPYGLLFVHKFAAIGLIVASMLATALPSAVGLIAIIAINAYSIFFAAKKLYASETAATPNQNQKAA